jgi:pimeloyl-ACP methyl ester carboxylesterase
MKYGLLLILLIAFSPRVSAEIKTIDLGEFYIEYESEGESDFVILLEAGSGGDLTRWDEIYDDFSKIGHTIRYTRIGNESISQIKRQFSAEEYAFHLNLFLEKLDISKPVIIVSHSYGALITRMFSANYPKHVAGMLLIDPNTEIDNDIMRSITSPMIFLRTRHPCLLVHSGATA